MCTKRLVTAEKLINGLGHSESRIDLQPAVRWREAPVAGEFGESGRAAAWFEAKKEAHHGL